MTPKQEYVPKHGERSVKQALRRTISWLGLMETPDTPNAPVHRRVRLSMYLVLFIVGLVSARGAWQIEKSEAVRLADAEVIRFAGAQSTLAQRMGMLAALLAVADGPQEERRNALSETIAQSQEQAPRLDALLLRQGVWEADASEALRAAVFEWQDRRERLWYQAQLVLWHGDRRDVKSALSSMKSLQDEVERSLLTTQILVEQVQLAAQQRARNAINHIEWSALAMVFLLLGLTIGVAEPLARFVKRQYQTLYAQSQELKRLALVAERTSNWVAVLDAQRHVLWANLAFLQGRGSTLAQLVGKHPGLLSGEYNDPHEMVRLREALDRGLGVRQEIHTRSGAGRDLWLDVDYQPIVDVHGMLAGFTIVAVDITERVNQQLKMKSLLDALPVGVVLQAASGEVLECNVAATQMLGLGRQELLGRAGLAREGIAVHDDLTPYPVNERPSIRTLRTGQGLRGESIGLVAPDGDLRWLMVNTEPLRDSAGVMTGVVSCTVDVTDQRAQQQLLALATEGASLGIWQWDVTTGTMTCNDRLLNLYGYERGGLGMTVSDWNSLIHPDDLKGWLWAIKTNLKDSQRPLHWEVRIRHGLTGQWTWTMYSGTVVARNAEGRAVRMAGICYDINAQKEMEAQLRQAARTDHLTALPNRGEVLNRILSCLQRSRQEPGYHFAVLFMDFDRFKQVNDTLGHAVGDDLLRLIAQRLQDSLRPGDAFVHTSNFSQMAARLGGDEFVVLLDDIRGDLDAQVVASRLLDLLAEPYQIGPHRVNSSVSIGVVTSEHMADDPGSVLRDADIAMYEAKREGRGRYVMFEPSMRKRLRDDVALENDLRQALKNGELSVAYQPLINMDNGRLASLEALVRWQHPQRGAVSPLDFIPMAETCGLIEELGLFVLNTACEQFARWQAELGERAPPTISVNLSRAQLRQPGLVANLFDVLFATGMAADQLILEVTESLAAQDSTVQTTLRAIRALGVALSLDDFGTGYSSLSCLHELPVNIVKIDRSFVSQALNSDYHRVMIEATIRMAQTLGLATVAEGIETAQQDELLRVLGCGKGQGYFYSPPLKAEALEAWIASRYACA